MNKKCVCIFILFLLFILSPAIVFAVDSQDIYSYVNTKPQNDGTAIIEYRVYNAGGLHDGTFALPKDLYEKNSYMLFISESGTIYYLYTNYNNARFFQSVTNNNTQYIFYGGEYVNLVGLKYYAYFLNDEGNWEGTGGTPSYVPPDSVLLTKNATFHFYDKVPNNNSEREQYYNNNPGVDYQLLKTNQFLVSPTMKYRVDQGFRLLLNDFYGFTAIEENRELIAGLTGLKLTVYNNDTGQEMVTDFDILAYKDVQQLEDGSYYVDIDFKDVMPFMNTVDSTYTIFIISNLQVTSISAYTEGYPGPLTTVGSNYQSLDYFQYRYTGGAGILIEVDKDGNPLNPGTDPTPVPTPDPVAGAIDKNTEAINEQTNAINEQTEVSKNIFQQIIELPR